MTQSRLDTPFDSRSLLAAVVLLAAACFAPACGGDDQSGTGAGSSTADGGPGGGEGPGSGTTGAANRFCTAPLTSSCTCTSAASSSASRECTAQGYESGFCCGETGYPATSGTACSCRAWPCVTSPTGTSTCGVAGIPGDPWDGSPTAGQTCCVSTSGGVCKCSKDACATNYKQVANCQPKTACEGIGRGVVQGCS